MKSKPETTKSITIVNTRPAPTIQKVLVIKFSRDFYREHRAEFMSTSPFAATDQTPESRIESTPVTYTAFDPMNGQEYITTTIVRKDILTCPVTGKEFTDDKLAAYRQRLEYEAKRFGYDEAQKLSYRENFDILSWHTFVNGKEIVLRADELMDFEYRPLKLVEKVEDVLTDLQPSDSDTTTESSKAQSKLTGGA